MKKENLKIIAVITVIVVIASVLGAFVFISGENNEYSEDNEENNEGTYVSVIRRSYEVSIDSDGNYTVYLPIPVNETGVSYIMDNFKLVVGNCTYRIENTTFGLALNITGRGHVALESSADYRQYIENWTVVRTSGVNPKENPITLSMSNITYKRDSADYKYSNATGYNTTRMPFEIPKYWKTYDNDGYLMPPSWVDVHSFVYVNSEKPANITLSLQESYYNSRTTWKLVDTFTENGWHYVNLNIGMLVWEPPKR